MLKDFIKQNGNESAFRLAKYLEREGGPVGNDIVRSFKQFSASMVARWNEITSRYNLDYALKEFTRKDSDQDV